MEENMQWYEKESFWKDLYFYLFPAARFEAACDEVSKVIQLARFGGKTVLDLCCGPGRHSVELAKKGYKVTGVDRSPYLLDRARTYAEREDVSVQWIEEDMREFICEECFDMVINLFTSFGYFESKNDDKRVIHNIYKNLKPGGKFVIELTGKEILARLFQETSSARFEEEGITFFERHKIIDGWSRICNEWIIMRDDGSVTKFELEHTIYSGQELKYLMEDAGFKHVQVYGSLDGDDYDQRSMRLILIGEK